MDVKTHWNPSKGAGWGVVFPYKCRAESRLYIGSVYFIWRHMKRKYIWLFFSSQTEPTLASAVMRRSTFGLLFHLTSDNCWGSLSAHRRIDFSEVVRRALPWAPYMPRSDFKVTHPARSDPQEGGGRSVLLSQTEEPPCNCNTKAPRSLLQTQFYKLSRKKKPQHLVSLQNL